MPSILTMLQRVQKRSVMRSQQNLYIQKEEYTLLRCSFFKYNYCPEGLINRPFPSSLVPLVQKESKCETIHMKMSCACSFIFMQIKAGRKINFFSGRHLAPKYVKVVANSKKLVAIMTHTHKSTFHASINFHSKHDQNSSYKEDTRV